MIFANYSNNGINLERKIELEGILIDSYLNYPVNFKSLGFFINLYGCIEGVYLYYALLMPREKIEEVLRKYNICAKSDIIANQEVIGELSKNYNVSESVILGRIEDILEMANFELKQTVKERKRQPGSEKIA